MSAWREVAESIWIFLTVIALAAASLWISESWTPCSNLKPDKELMDRISHALHKDPDLARLLDTNNYTIRIIDYRAHPVTTQDTTKCVVDEAIVDVVFSEPVYVREHGFLGSSHWTNVLTVDVILSDNVIDVNATQVKIRDP